MGPISKDSESCSCSSISGSRMGTILLKLTVYHMNHAFFLGCDCGRILLSIGIRPSSRSCHQCIGNFFFLVCYSFHSGLLWEGENPNVCIPTTHNAEM